MTDVAAPSWSRVSTGIPQLDEILMGGFPAHSINILMGHPGTGKTILAEQMLFHNARDPTDDRPVLYVTTLSEPLAKVVSYLQRFSFYDEEALLGRVVYDDIGSALAEEGPEVVVDRLRGYIRDVGPRLIVVDSFKAIHDLATSATQMRCLVSELAAVLTAYDTTTFLIGEYDEGQVAVFPEFAVADAIVELARKSTAKRDERFLRVLKLRGSHYAEGFHAFRITEDGLRVFPRLVSPDIPADVESRRERVSTGVEGLDDVLGGGLWRGSTALVSGRAGSGKTTLALQFLLDGVEAGEPGLFVNFQENPTQMARTIAGLGGDVGRLTDAGLFLQYRSPVELQIDSILVELFETVRREGIRRVAIDALGDLAVAASDAERFHDYMYALAQHLTSLGVTSLLTLEVGEGVGVPQQARFSSLSDVLIDLAIDMRGDPVRTLRVVKARGTSHDLRYHRMTIDGGGARLAAPLVTR